MSPSVKILRRALWKETKHPRHPYLTTSPAVFQYHGITVPDCEIYHRARALAYVHRNQLTILTGYAWNGMTLYPEKQESATDPGNKTDSLLHDFHYQTGLIARRPADRILAHMARIHDSFAWGIYLGVRIGGWRFYAKDHDIKIIRENTSDDHDSHTDYRYA